MITYPQLSWPAEDLPERLRLTIEQYRDEADETRRLPKPLREELCAQGAFRLNAPRELGGFELPVASTMNLIERLARIDGAVAWTVWNLNLGVGAAFLSERAVQRIWSAGPDPLIAHSSQPGFLLKDEEGYRLCGEWKLVSGANSAQWFAFLGVVMDGGQPRMTELGPDVRWCVVPRSAVAVHDTWHASALRGTDSNTVIVADAALDNEMIVAPHTASRIDRPLFRVPLTNQLTSGGAAIVLGMAQSGIDEAIAYLRNKKGLDGAALEQQPRVQGIIGQAAARLGAARTFLLTTIAVLDAAAAARRPATEAERGAVRGALCYAAETARAVLTSMYDLAGSSVVYESSRLGRLFRDGHAAAQHLILSPAHYELAGRIAMGLPGNDPAL